MALYERLAELPVEIEGYELAPLSLDVSSDFTRDTTVIRLHGGGEQGIGEDVTYDGLDHVAFQEAGATIELAGAHTLGSLSELLTDEALFPVPPVRAFSYNYRRWGFESAALDLALRQTGRSLAEAVGREPRPVRFVISLRLGSPASIDPLRKRLALYPSMRFKLDPTNEWTEQLIAELAATGAVDTLDLKSFYEGSPVDVETDPQLYRWLLDAFPDEVWLEDADATDPETRELLAPHAARLTWDAPLHSVADIEGAPLGPPRMVNIKPSRFGSLRELCAVYEHCEARGIGMYGGGQFELGPGRGQIQYLASLFHPDNPNDVAPVGYHVHEIGPGLPQSPLPPAPAPTGFRWSEG